MKKACLGLALPVVMFISLSAVISMQDAGSNLPPTVYLFSSFRGNGDGLHLAWSVDGLKWTALNEDRILLQPEVGGKLMRDPCILQGPDGTFHMVWTSGWYERVIGYASSKDLRRWSPQRTIPVMEHEPTARNAWAPEIAYDAANRLFIIFWASTIPGRFPETDASGDHGLNHRMYCTTTRDFQTFTPTRLFFDPGYSVIDATLVQKDGRFYLVFKVETAKPVMKHLRVAVSDGIMGPYKVVTDAFTDAWVEGPAVLCAGDRYIVYYDRYRDRKYGAMQSGDLLAWKDITEQLSLPAGTRHGTAFSP